MMKRARDGRRPRVLVLNQHYWPEIAATAQILSDICEDLSARGFDVSVICGQPSYHVAERPRLRRAERHGDVEIERVWSYRPVARGVPRRVASYGSFFCASLLRAVRTARPDVCLVVSTPPLLLGVTGVLLQALRGVPFVYCVQDLYPDVAVHLGVLREHGPLTRAVSLVSNLCYRRAAALVTLSHGMASSLVAKGIPPERIHVIPNWADTSSVEPRPRDNDFARRHGLVGPFVVQYSGNLGLSQGLENVIEAADMLRELPVKFVFVGEGNAKASLEAAVRSRGLGDSVMFLPPQPRAALSELLASCDVGLVTMKTGLSQDLVPSKLYGIMAAARPVLASVEPSSEVARVLESSRCGWTVAPEDARALAEQVRSALELSAGDRGALGLRGREACVMHYGRSVLTGRYGEVIAAVLARGPAVSPAPAAPEPRQTRSSSRGSALA